MKTILENELAVDIKGVTFVVLMYFIFCLIIPTALDILFWRKLNVSWSKWLNIMTIIFLNSAFLISLTKCTSFKLEIFSNISNKGIILSIACSILFYLVLDKGLDPFFDRMFPQSAKGYEETIILLRSSPATSFIRVCFIAPIIEEILMRGYVLGGLRGQYSTFIAVLVSSIIFALLHFNYVQTLSAIICGLVLGLLYINTGSLFSCILAHFLYNAISFFTMIIKL